MRSKRVVEVPLSQITVLEGTYPRDNTNNENVEHLKEAFLGEKPPAPIELIPVIGTPSYVLIDGRHRMLAKESMNNGGKIAAILITDIKITKDNLYSPEIVRQVHFLATKENSAHGKPLTREERIQNARNLYAQGYKIKDLRFLASEKTLSGWLEIEKQEKKQQIEEKKAKVLDFVVNKNQPVRTVAKQNAVSPSTVRSWKKQKEKDTPIRKNNNEKNSDMKKHEGVGEIRKLPVSPIPQLGDQYHFIYEATRKLHNPHNPLKPEDDKFLAEQLLPLMVDMSLSVKKIVKDNGYSSQIKTLVAENGSLKDEIRKWSQSLSDANKTIEKLQNDLNQRKDHCNKNCVFSHEKANEEFTSSLAGLCNSLDMLLAAKSNKDVLEITITNIFDFISYVDYAVNQSFINEKTYDKFSMFKKKIIEVLGKRENEFTKENRKKIQTRLNGLEERISSLQRKKAS